MVERARKRLRSTTATATAYSGSRSLSLVARHSKIGASMEKLVVIGGTSPRPRASLSPPKPFRTPSLSIKKLHAESKFAIENIVISLPLNFLSDGNTLIVWPYTDHLLLPSSSASYQVATPMATCSTAAELS